jgi:hypothetical protein
MNDLTSVDEATLRLWLAILRGDNDYEDEESSIERLAAFIIEVLCFAIATELRRRRKEN